MNLAIIPARGGSKRIPRKNVKDFHGRPMIAYAITAAKESKLFDRIIVSTDDEEIANLARKWGAEVPFTRPPQLANDYIATVPVIAHGIEECRKLGWNFDKVCCIYPCVPFIKIEDLRGALDLMNGANQGYCFPVTEYSSAIQRALKLSTDKKTTPFFPEFELSRTQDLDPAYYDAGQFYWATAETWLTNSNIHSSGIGFKVPNWRVLDIDTMDDWARAEMYAPLFGVDLADHE